jgi:hypothetical protein
MSTTIAARKEWPPEADTIITGQETGLPLLTESLDIDHIAGCRGWCNQGRQPCKTPHVCRTGTRLHRVVEVLSHPTDEVLRSGTLDQIAADRRHEHAGMRWLLAACAVAAVAILGFARFVASLPVLPQ